MPRYAVAINRAGINTANSPLLELRTPSNTPAYLEQIQIYNAVLSTTAPRFVLARPTNTPAGGTNNVPVGLDPNTGASLCSLISTGWTTAPTFSTSGPWLEVGGLPLTLGAGLIWVPPCPIMVNVSAALILANLNASGATLGSYDVKFTWNE